MLILFNKKEANMFITKFVGSQHIVGHDNLVNGPELAEDATRVLNALERDGYTVVSITPIIGGRWQVKSFDSRVTATLIPAPTTSPDTCSSFGYSMTDGLLIVAQKK